MARRMLMKKMGDTKKLSPQLDTESLKYRKGGTVGMTPRKGRKK